MSSGTGIVEDYCVYVRFRPYVFLFLEEMSEYYEIIVFTAAESSYKMEDWLRIGMQGRLLECSTRRSH